MTWTTFFDSPPCAEGYSRFMQGIAAGGTLAAGLANVTVSDRIWAATHSIHQELSALLAHDGNWSIRQALGYYTPFADVLALLVGDENGDVRQGVALNAAAPPAILSALSRDEDAYVRRNVAGNERADAETLRRLSADDKVIVRQALYQNRLCPPEELAAAVEAGFFLPDIAQNPATPEAALQRLAAHENEHVRAAVASNPATPADTLAALALDPTGFVRANAAANPNLDPATLLSLCNDGYPPARRNARMHPKLADAVRERQRSINALD